VKRSEPEAGLHPLLAHHIVNTMEWPALRPLQKAAIRPILSGSHAVLTAPTAGGKTEAAVFPLLSRILSEEWAPLSVLYLCPLRALLNNLHPRIEHYAGLVGRRAGLWHGDVGESARERLREEPPDILLTTPESIEAMLISRKTDHRWMFRNVRALVVDEIHAFAGDDRGWHLLAVAERVQRIADRPLQRIGLSATVGNPQEMVEWLSRTCPGDRVVVSPPGPSASTAPEVIVDFVGSLDNAATVISRMHRGEKRLVFVDSRARVEELAAALREKDVRTFLSHGSLGREERRQAEEAFASSRDCVIVATSTLELGIDVGDLDRVIQVDAPSTVAAFLQRLGRTGRREGATSNTLFLVTREDAFLQTLGLLRCWEEGFVEPIEPAPLPLHLLVQQLLAIVLQEGGVGRRTWPEWLGPPFVLGTDVAAAIEEVTDDLLRADFLFEDSGILGIGERGERTFGGRHFMDLMAVFSEPPTLRVLAGRAEIGEIPMQLLALEREGGHRILLAGRHWDVREVDWKRRVVQVAPASDPGRARWIGEGRALSFEVSQGIRKVLGGLDLQQVRLSRRGKEKLAAVREEFSWVRPEGETVLVRTQGEQWWWTFAGMNANTWFASGLQGLADQLRPDDLRIRVRPDADPDELQQRVRELDPETLTLGDRVATAMIDRLKFADALPGGRARAVVERRMRDDEAVREVATRPLRVHSPVPPQV
jgi:ATP-dependent helicase Lhr and Lhr-like helicase